MIDAAHLDIEIPNLVVGLLDSLVDGDGHGGDRRQLLGDTRGQFVDPGPEGEELHFGAVDHGVLVVLGEAVVGGQSLQNVAADSVLPMTNGQQMDDTNRIRWGSVREDGLQICWLLTASQYIPEKCIRVFICNATIDQEAAIVVLRRQRAVLCLLTPSNVGLCAVVTHRSFELANHVGGEDAGVRWVHVRKTSGREVHRVVRVNAAVWFGFYVHCCSLDEIQVWQEMTLLADLVIDNLTVKCLIICVAAH